MYCPQKLTNLLRLYGTQHKGVPLHVHYGDQCCAGFNDKEMIIMSAAAAGRVKKMRCEVQAVSATRAAIT